MDVLISDVKTKVCAHCKVEKTVDCFYKHPTAKYGVGVVCKDCTKAYNAARARGQKFCESDTLVCCNCNEEKPLTAFCKDASSRTGYHTRCRKCAAKYAKEKRLHYNSIADRPLPTEKFCPRCKQTLPAAEFGKDKGGCSGLQGICKGCAFTQREVLRREVLSHYSTNPPFCACCGETTPEFLSIDHINGGGRQHERERRNTGQVGSLMLWLRKNNYPEGYQVLCHNCNQCKGYYGVCVHQRKKLE